MCVASLEADAHSRVRAVEAAVVSLAGVDAAVHSAEEEIGAIAEAHLGVGIFEGETREAADVGDRYAARARVIGRRGKHCGRVWGCRSRQEGPDMIERLARRLMMGVRLLPAEQDGSVHAPI